MFRPSRDNRGDDRFFELKALILVLGASLGIAGMIYEIEWLIWAAIAVVAVAIILRMMANRKGKPD